MLKISLIIPVYNSQEYITKCINSCLDQGLDYKYYEIIVINDGSTDDSLKYLEFIKNDNPRANIHIYSQVNKGLSQARNAGISYSKGKYIWFIDSDDYISSNSLEKLCIAFDDLTPDIIRFNSCLISPENSEVLSIRNNSQSCDSVLSGKELLYNPKFDVCATTYVVNREFLLQCNMFFYDKIYHEDMEFTPRLYYLAKEVLLMNHVMYNIQLTPNSITRSFRMKKSIDLILIADRLSSFFIINKEQRCFHFVSRSIFSSLNNFSHCPSSEFNSMFKPLKALILERRSLITSFKYVNIIKHRLFFYLSSLISLKQTLNILYYMMRIKSFARNK